MSTRSARARANAISEHSASTILASASHDDVGYAQDQNGEDDADDEDDESGDVNAPSGVPARGRRAGRPRKTPITAPKPTCGSSPTIDELLRDQDYHMVDYEDFEDSASVIERFALDDIGQGLGLDINSDLDPDLQHILDEDKTGVQHSIEDPFDNHIGSTNRSVRDHVDTDPGPKPRRRRSFIHDPDGDAFANFQDLIGPYPSLQDEIATREAHAHLRLAMHGFHTSSFPGTPLTRRRFGSPSNCKFPVGK